MTSFTSWPIRQSRSAGKRALLRCTTRFGATGAHPSPEVSKAIWPIQESRSPGEGALCVGNEPITPARQAAITNSGPDTLVIGAAITGSARAPGHAADRINGSISSFTSELVN
ncbi:Uncharacterised protein [Mycolicibacterium fortuitum]|uniref:Uncharacterized protein n=1 Tax=Mycolicibacterium fortuitum TaxID=1766 RepID=A0A378U6Y4_MYCFO|nr:Uncharacterised protein [Mycolicibacterium fortuitum]